MEPRRALAPAAYKKLAQYLSLPLCETHRACNRFFRLSGKYARGWSACTQTALPNRRSGTVYSNEAQNRTLDICRQDQSLIPTPRRNSRNAPGLPFQPCAACAAQGDPRGLVVPLAVACGLAYPSFRAFPASLLHDNHGDRTCDPQTPPSVSLNGLQLQLFTRRLKNDSLPDQYPIGLLQTLSTPGTLV